MLFSTRLALAFSTLAFFVNAQDTTSPTDSAAVPTSTSGITPCILTCVTDAASTAGCASATDLECVCTNTAFQEAAAECLQSTCTADEVAQALQLQQAECADITGSGSATASATATEGTTTGTASSPTATSPATTTGTTTKPSTSSTSTTSSKAGTTTSSAAAATSTSPNAASGLKVGFADGTLVGTVLALSGALVGGLLVF